MSTTGEVLSVLFGLAGSATSASISLPQAIRSIRHPTVGVSSVTFQLITSTSITWTSYAIAEHLWLLAAGNIVLAISSFVVLWSLHRDGAKILDLTYVFAPVMVIAVIVGWLDPVWLGWLAGAISVALRFPQLRLVKVAESIHGVSIHTWMVMTMTNACWLGYGLLHDDIRLTVICTINTLTSASVVSAVFFRRRRDARLV